MTNALIPEKKPSTIVQSDKSKTHMSILISAILAESLTFLSQHFHNKRLLLIGEIYGY